MGINTGPTSGQCVRAKDVGTLNSTSMSTMSPSKPCAQGSEIYVEKGAEDSTSQGNSVLQTQQG